MTEFSQEEIKVLAQMERGMDSGKLAHVKLGIERVVMRKKELAHFALEVGQTITWQIMKAIILYRIEECQKQIDAKAIEDLKPSDFK